MEVGELRDKIVEQYGIEHVYGDCKSEERDFYSMDGINEKATFYIAGRISDGKITKEVISDISEIKLFSIDGLDMGTASELRERGRSWSEIFIAVQENVFDIPYTTRNFE